MATIPFSLQPNKITGAAYLPEEFNQIVNALTAVAAAYPMANLPTPASLGLFANKIAGQKMFATEYNGIVNLLGQVITAANSSATTPPATTNTKPVVSFTAPASGATVTVGTALTLTATATDDVSVSSVEFLNGTTGASIGVGSKNGTTYTLAYTPTVAGQLSLVAKATDGAGLTDTATVNFTVAAAAPTGPQKLAAPAQPQAKAVSISALNVLGSSVAGATGYKYHRSTAEAGPYDAVGSTQPTPNFADTGLTSNTTYWYKLQALGNGTTTSDSDLGTAFSGKTPAPRGTIEIRGGGATQSNFAGAAPREQMPNSYYISSPRLYGLSIPRNAVEPWSLGAYNNGAPDQNTANDNGLYPPILPPFGGHGPAPAFAKQWLANNASNAKSMLFFTLDVTTPDSVNSTTTRWLSFLLAQWKGEWVKMVALLKAQGWTGMRVILYHDLGEGNAMTDGELPKYYGDMVNIIGQMETHIGSFAGPGFSATTLGHGIIWKQQNWGSFNIAANINPLQTQLVANVPKAFKVEMPNVDPVNSFQDQYGNGTRVHYTSAEILRLGAYMAEVESSLDIGLVFKEEFNDAASLAANWTTDGFTGESGLVTFANGELRIQPKANVSGVNLTGLRTINKFPVTDRRFIIDMKSVGAGVNNVAVGMQTTLGDAQYMLFLLLDSAGTGTLYCGDGYTYAATEIPFSFAEKRFIAIWPTATEVRWQSSPDGIIWSTLVTRQISALQVVGFNFSQAHLTIFANTISPIANPGLFTVESAKLEIV